jgi:hypothetical protein
VDFFQDARVLEAEDRHSRRRKRARRVYDNVNRVFFAGLLVLVFLVFKRFYEFVEPYLFWF